jgi:hypothetical protein
MGDLYARRCIVYAQGDGPLLHCLDQHFPPATSHIQDPVIHADLTYLQRYLQAAGDNGSARCLEDLIAFYVPKIVPVV